MRAQRDPCSCESGRNSAVRGDAAESPHRGRAREGKIDRQDPQLLLRLMMEDR